jgi:hypothetical protein
MVSINTIQKRVAIERKYVKGLRKNWLSPEEQQILKRKMGGELTNSMRSQLEIHQFKKERPSNYFAYVDLPKRIVTTWTGQKIGTITRVGREHKVWGSERVPIRFKAINKANYSGTLYSGAGDYGRFKKVK